MRIILLYIFSFILGGVPFGYLIGRYIYNVDIRSKGSGNIGATNVFRTLGVIPGLIVFATDLLKGAIPVLIGRAMGLPKELFLLAGALSVLGHCFSPFLNFKGGKGVSSTYGMMIAFDPVVAILSLLVEGGFIAIWGYVSLGSIASVICMVLFLIVRGHNLLSILIMALTAMLIIVRHKDNIKRLLEGKENRFTLKGH
ncbi:MAG: glycerol-3-phosphate 1-O-acyltransferase PlsY [bacterium]|nr:glycerol-3-phosphate 1-O-acyltransferase PlsY [bacterium]